MTLTAIVGGLVAFVAKPKAEDPWDRLETVVARVDALTRSQQKLIDHIERLERELALQRELEAHWRGEAMHLARQNRERREAAEKAQDALAQHLHGQQLAGPQMNAALYQQLGQQVGLYQGFCNCVPSRTQVWDENVARLNEAQRELAARTRLDR